MVWAAPTPVRWTGGARQPCWWSGAAAATPASESGEPAPLFWVCGVSRTCWCCPRFWGAFHSAPTRTAAAVCSSAPLNVWGLLPGGVVSLRALCPCVLRLVPPASPYPLPPATSGLSRPLGPCHEPCALCSALWEQAVHGGSGCAAADPTHLPEGRCPLPVSPRRHCGCCVASAASSGLQAPGL